MPEPRKLTGYKMTACLIEIKELLGEAKLTLGSFADPQRPPATEREWTQFLATVLAVYGTLDRAQAQAEMGLDIARENEVVRAVEPRTVLTELIERLEEYRDERH